MQNKTCMQNMHTFRYIDMHTDQFYTYAHRQFTAIQEIQKREDIQT